MHAIATDIHMTTTHNSSSLSSSGSHLEVLEVPVTPMNHSYILFHIHLTVIKVSQFALESEVRLVNLHPEYAALLAVVT